MTPEHIAEWNLRLANASPLDVLRAAWDALGRDCAIAFSGAEDVAVLGLMRDAGLDFPVFALDTGRLHGETHRLFEAVRTKLGVELDVYLPDTGAVQDLVRAKGSFSFYQDGHGECCGIRKVEPLRRALTGRRGWITGQRRDQSLDTRAQLPIVQVDASNPGLVKWNPLAAWTSAKVWAYIRGAGLPYNALHERGFVSIGCEPCTRPVLPGQHEREGRWWWEQADKKECGLHTARG